MDEKRREKYLQSRYRRELERYLNRVVGFVMGDAFSKSAYEAMIERVGQKLEKVEKTKLYSDFFERLEQFVQRSRELAEGELESDEIRAKILHEANQIRKSKRKKSYNRRERGRRDEEESG